jgi:hypothetical protein
VAYPDDQNQQDLVANLAEHPVVTDSDPPKPFLRVPRQANRATRSGIGLEPTQRSDDPAVGFSGEPIERPPGRRYDVDAVGAIHL